MATAVEMLRVWRPSPPVPHTSIAPRRRLDPDHVAPQDGGGGDDFRHGLAALRQSDQKASYVRIVHRAR